MSSSNEILLRFEGDDPRFSVIVDCDERVAYAYLLEGEKILGDVWLFNVATTPEKVDWGDRSQMPFLNPREYCFSEPAPDLNANLSVEWAGTSARIVSDGKLIAVLVPGAKPGWSYLARRDGPLAKTLASAP